MTAKILASGLALVLLGGACTSATAPTPTPGPTVTPSATQGPSATEPGQTSLPTAIPASPDPTVSPTDSPTATPRPTLAPQAVEMPFVPVVSFWATRSSISLDGLRDAVSRGDVLIADPDIPAVADALGIPPYAREQPVTAADVRRGVRDEGTLGILRATEVDPSVRALAIGGVNLFGNDRIQSLGEWPLTATVQSTETWRQDAAWTLVAAGDIMLDRGVARQTTILGKGADYLFNGGTARVTRVRCCSFYNYEYPDVERTGNAGAVRKLLRGADITMANLETAVLENAPYHDSGFRFTSDASLLPAFADAGFDLLSLANNHSRDAGARGLTTAMEHLEALGIAHSGAGIDDVDAARPTYLDVGQGQVAVIACDAIRPSSRAKPGKVGTLNCRQGPMRESIREANENADVVIVFPHWGVEYYPTPRTYQRRLAAEWVDAGADLIIGAHSHFPGGMEDIDGHLVFYSLGNFIFDQDFRQATMMGLVPEMTFIGDRLAQVWLHTTLIVDTQPNLANPETDGQFAYDLVRRGSRGLLDY